MVNCVKCSVDLRGLQQYSTEYGQYCEHCYCKYILKKPKRHTDSFKSYNKNKEK